jgi:hypothetical protein
VALINTAYMLTAQPRHQRHGSSRSAPETVAQGVDS